MASTRTATILFVDLVGSTARLSALGDDDGVAFLQRFGEACKEVVRRHDGRVVKHLGDGFMVVFEQSSLEAVRCAADLHHDVGLLDPDDPPALRVGISAGEVTEEDGDLFGTPVIEAARLCDLAPSGGTYTTSVVRGLVGNRGRLDFAAVGPVTLKGLATPTEVVRVTAGASAPRTATEVPRRSRLRWMAAGAAVAVLGAATAVIVISRGPTSGEGRVLAAVREQLDYKPISTTVDCTEKQARPGRTCGMLRVPETRTNPGGRQVDLPYTVDPPLEGAPADRAEVVVGGAIDTTQSAGRRGGRSIDLAVRGREGDPVLRCPEVAEAGLANVTRPLLDPGTTAALVDGFGRCHDRLAAEGVDLAAYDTEDVALDVRDLLVALELPPVDLVVSNKVTSVGLVLLRERPQLLRTLTLQTPVATDAAPGDFSVAYSDGFDAYVDACRSDPACPAATTDLRAAWRAAYERLQKSPLLVTGPLPDGSSATVLLDGDRASLALETALGAKDLNPYIAGFLADPTFLGDPTAPATMQIAYNAYVESFVEKDYPYGQELSDICHRVLPNDNPLARDLAARQPELALPWYRNLPALCAKWPVPPAEEAFRRPPSGNVPVMMVVGLLAQDTRHSWPDEMARSLSSVTIIRFATIGQKPLDSGPECLSRIRAEWLTQPTVPSQSTVAQCEAATPRISFFGT